MLQRVKYFEFGFLAISKKYFFISKFNLNIKKRKDIERGKKQKVDHGMKRSLLFGECPDEVVLIILSFCPEEDIENTRIWQTGIVRHSTETRIKLKAAKNDNLDNLKWIYDYIGDTEFCFDFYRPENCTGK